VHKAQQAHKVHKATLVQLVQQVRKDLLVLLVQQEMLARLDQQVHNQQSLVQQVRKVQQDQQARKVFKV
jgi:hypothetical protein